MAVAAGTSPRGIVNTNFVLDAEGSSLVVTKEGLDARDGLDTGEQVTIRGTARDLHRIGTSAHKRKAHSERLIVDGDRRQGHIRLHVLLAEPRAGCACPDA